MTKEMAEAIHDNTPRAGIAPMPNPFIAAEVMMKVGLELTKLHPFWPFWAPFMPRR